MILMHVKHLRALPPSLCAIFCPDRYQASLKCRFAFQQCHLQDWNLNAVQESLFNTQTAPKHGNVLGPVVSG